MIIGFPEPVHGGATRSESVFEGIKAASSD
jgi:2-C-methyl-D-erythritol 4-phosphate cytidylyltransferase